MEKNSALSLRKIRENGTADLQPPSPASAEMLPSSPSNGFINDSILPTAPSKHVPTPHGTRAVHDNAGRKVNILVYPTVSPETIVVPILSCIFGIPVFAFLVICCLRHRAKNARERDRRRNFDLQANTITLVRFNSLHNNSSSRSILLESGDSLSKGYPSLELDTVYEERLDNKGDAPIIANLPQVACVPPSLDHGPC